MKTHSRSAFTLVELLVVIAIIGMLMALLLPAVNSAKESGRRAVCLNNQKQLALAMRNYESQKRELPGYANGIAKTSSTDPGRLATWVVMLFPFMERTDVYEKWSDSTIAATALPMPYMELLVCPSNPPESQTGPALAYVANCGIQDKAIVSSPPVSPTDTSNYARSEKPANGVFFNRYDLPIANRFMQISMSIDKIPDGASNTLMLSENTAAFRYTDDTNTSSATSYHQYASAQNGAECGTGFVWDKTVTGNIPSHPSQRIDGLEIGPPKDTKDMKIGVTWPLGATTPTKQYWYARPSSMHNGGVNAAFCGGEVIFLRDDIDYKVYQQLMTSDGSHSDMPGTASDPTTNKGYVLQDSDYK